MLSIGSPAPDFTLPDQNGNAVTLGELLTDGPAVIYFYPADFTPVCTAEACAFRDLHPELLNAGIHLAGVSPQSQDSHDRFRSRFSLPFTLLSDPEKRVVKAYGANGPFGLMTRRVTYLIAPDRIVRAAVRADLSAGRHTAFVREAIAAAETGAA